MFELPAVTVVIPTRNRRGFLPDAIASVLEQRSVTFEIVIVDDGSSDETPVFLSTLANPPIRTKRLDPSHGRAGACNAGMTDVGSKFVMFLDDDDLLQPRALATLAAALNAAPQAVAAVGARWERFERENYERRDAHPRVARVRRAFDDLLFGWSAPSGQTLYRTTAVRDVGGFRPEFERCEDRDLLLRLARRGPFVFRPELVLTYRWHGAQTDRSDIRTLREAVARRAIRSLPRKDRRRALLIRRSTRWFDAAQDAFSAGQTIRGVRAAISAVAMAPALLFLSPLSGPLFVRRLVGRIWRRLAA